MNSWKFYGLLSSVAACVSIQVAPIDKLSFPITVVLAWWTLGQPISLRLGIGIGIGPMASGAFLMVGA